MAPAPSASRHAYSPVSATPVLDLLSSSSSSEEEDFESADPFERRRRASATEPSSAGQRVETLYLGDSSDSDSGSDLEHLADALTRYQAVLVDSSTRADGGANGSKGDETRGTESSAIDQVESDLLKIRRVLPQVSLRCALATYKKRGRSVEAAVEHLLDAGYGREVQVEGSGQGKGESKARVESEDEEGEDQLDDNDDDEPTQQADGDEVDQLAGDSNGSGNEGVEDEEWLEYASTPETQIRLVFTSDLCAWFYAPTFFELRRLGRSGQRVKLIASRDMGKVKGKDGKDRDRVGPPVPTCLKDEVERVKEVVKRERDKGKARAVDRDEAPPRKRAKKSTGQQASGRQASKTAQAKKRAKDDNVFAADSSDAEGNSRHPFKSAPGWGPEYLAPKPARRPKARPARWSAWKDGKKDSEWKWGGKTKSFAGAGRLLEE
ncbi:hypothetical protein JCM10212_001631 [Sporobolomyces blumeae]